MLSDIKAWNANGKSKSYKLADSAHLYLLIRPNGSKSWCWRYFFDDRPKTLMLGHYPALSIVDARVKRDKLKAVLEEGRDPRIVKKLQIEENAAAAGTTFEKAARAWHAHTRSRWSSIHADDVIRSLERDVFPAIGNLPISDITPQLVLEVLRAIEGRGAIETAHRLRQRISASFAYAIAHGWATRDPAEKFDEALSPVKRARQPLIADLARLQKMIRDAEADSAPPITRYALRFIALTAVRPNEVQSGAWSEYEGLDSPEPLWRIPAWRMQGDREGMIKLSDHVVPLARQSVDVLRGIWPLTGGGHYIFPSARNAHLPMRADAISSLLRRAGYHGFNLSHLFRGWFSTIMNEWAERHGKEHDPDVINLMISYTRERPAADSCNRAVYMLRRCELAQIWADMLCEHLPEPELLMKRPSPGSSASQMTSRDEKFRHFNGEAATAYWDLPVC